MKTQELIKQGATLLKPYPGYEGIIPKSKWSINGKIFEMLECACCPGVAVWNWDSEFGRSDKLEDLLTHITTHGNILE